PPFASRSPRTWTSEACISPRSYKHMKNRSQALPCLLLSFGFLTVLMSSTPAAAADYKPVADGAIVTTDGGTLRIQFWSPEIVRVTYATGTQLPELKSLSVVATPQTVHLT